MKEFMLIFRMNVDYQQPTPEQFQARAKQWQDWIGGIAAQNKFSGNGKRLETDGKVVKPNNVVTDGPYVEIKESLGSYMFVKAASLEEAVEMARRCPHVVSKDGSVEVRPVMENNG